MKAATLIITTLAESSVDGHVLGGEDAPGPSVRVQAREPRLQADGDPAAGRVAAQPGDHLGDGLPLGGPAVDRAQEVAGPDAGAGGRAAGLDPGHLGAAVAGARRARAPTPV